MLDKKVDDHNRVMNVLEQLLYTNEIDTMPIYVNSKTGHKRTMSILSVLDNNSRKE